LISLALYKEFRSTLPISLYLAGSCAVSLVATLLARETKGLTFDEIDAEAARGGPARSSRASVGQTEP